MKKRIVSFVLSVGLTLGLCQMPAMASEISESETTTTMDTVETETAFMNEEESEEPIDMDGAYEITEDNPTLDPQYEKELMRQMNAEIMTMSLTGEGAAYKHADRFKNTQILNGVDVSSYQKTIDWKKAKADGVEFALIRLGYRGYGSSGRLCIDTYYDDNIEGALAVGIPVGLYVYSQAITEREAREEARLMIDRIQNYQIDLPLVFDFEYAWVNGALGGRLYDAHLTVAQATANCLAFCDEVEKAGYTPMIYANKSDMTSHLDMKKIGARAKIWLAQYNTSVTYTGDYDYWQYRSNGTVNGIPGAVDLNFWYKGSEMIEAPVTLNPQLIAAEKEGDYVRVSWKNFSAAKGYEILRKVNNTGEWQAIGQVEQGTYSFVDQLVSRGDIYTYTVRGIMDETGAEYSSYDEIGVSIDLSVNIPKMDEVYYTSNDRIRVRWEDVEEASFYVVYRKKNRGEWEEIARPLTNVYDDYLIADGQTYCYAVAAGWLQADGTEKITAFDDKGIVFTALVGTVKNIRLNQTAYNKIVVSWDAVDRATEYWVYRSVNGGSWKRIGTAKTTAYTDSVPDVGNKYSYRIKAAGTANGKTWYGSYESSLPTLVTKLDTIQVKPIGTGVNDGVYLSWNKVDGATGYRVYEKQDNGDWVHITTVTTLSYKKENLTPGMTYRYTVSAYHKNSDGKKVVCPYDKNGQEIMYPVKRIKMTGAVCQNYRTIKLTWEKNANAEGYCIYRRKASEDTWSKIASTGKDASSYTDKNCVSGQKYYYRVRATKSVNGVEKLGGYTSAIGETALPTPPVITSLRNGKKGVEIKWKKTAGAYGYYVYRRTNSGSWKNIATLKGGDSLFYTDTTVVKGLTYEYRMRAYTRVDTKVVNGSYNSNGTKILYQ